MALNYKTEIPVQSWPVGSSSNKTTTYTVNRYRDGSYSCDCTGWIIKKQGQERTCSHIRKVQDGRVLPAVAVPAQERTVAVTPKQPTVARKFRFED